MSISRNRKQNSRLVWQFDPQQYHVNDFYRPEAIVNGAKDLVRMGLQLFETYRQAMIGLPLSSIWRGYGTAIFLEFGELFPVQRKDGTVGNPKGEFTAMIEWSWRIENQTAILGGSWSDAEGWETLFKSVIGHTVCDIKLFGRLPELSVALSGEKYLVSFMTADGQPAWTLLKRHDNLADIPSLSVAKGSLIAGASDDRVAPT